jgi:hypothetical protein
MPNREDNNCFGKDRGTEGRKEIYMVEEEKY